MMSPTSLRASVLLALVVSLAGAASTRAQSLPPQPTMRAWVEEMKTAPRGPFERIAWFCQDGSVLAARAGCDAHGGGIQHGLWSQRTITLRDNGYKIANVLGDLNGDPFVGRGADLDTLRQILLERYMMAMDDGWVLRAAKTYRGALQAEDEEDGATRITDAMLSDPSWRTDERYFLLRETFRLLPRRREAGAVTAQDVRHSAMQLAASDRGFENLRIKIHGAPDGGDADLVRSYAQERGRAGLYESYMSLADQIDGLYAGGAAGPLRKAAAALPSGVLRDQLNARANILEQERDPESRLANSSDLVAVLRERNAAWQGVDARRAMMEASVALEDEMYASGNELASRIPQATRRQRLEWLWYLTSGLYGTGLVSQREAASARDAIRRMAQGGAPTVDVYQEQVAYVAQAPQWAGQTVTENFGEAVARFAELDPKANLFPQERLRGSPLLFYGAVSDSLTRDSGASAGIRHEIFGEQVSSGLRALNPGLARGTIRVPGAAEARGDFDRNGIYLLPETIADLSPVAGILTENEGSSLSHIQLLARNLGIPNVVVSNELLGRVRSHVGDRAVLAVSPKGVVQLSLDGPRWDSVFGRETSGAEFTIEPDLGKLDIESTQLVPLSDIRASDSGRLAGPKSANLGELKTAFGDQVPDGIVIPFGVFRKLLDQPIAAGGPSVFEWMRQQYDEIEQLAGNEAAQKRATSAFLSRLRSWIENSDPGDGFRAALDRALTEHFGPDGTYGVFVRSDTNVEDLPGFTGAGLNLTVPNVVGERNIYDAIRKVWASPFTERAFSWRQAHMRQPEYVFPAVLVQKAFPSEKSGVMVTKDVVNDREGWASIAVNEGVGGAVDGQAAESLLVNLDDEQTEVLAQAKAPTKRVLSPQGGVSEVPTSRRQRVLDSGEISQLVELARTAPQRFPLEGEDGQQAPADIEFAFANGRLALLQMRPFVESKGAQSSEYLASLDAKTGGGVAAAGRVSLDAVPTGGR